MSDANELMARADDARMNAQFDLARDILRRAVELLRQQTDVILLAEALRSLGEVERSLPDTDGGVAAYEEAVAIFEREGAELKLAHTVRHLADIHRHKEDVGRAGRSYDLALSLYRRHPEAPSIDLANALRGAALLKEMAGETKSALALWQEAIALYERAKITRAVEEGRRRAANLLQQDEDRAI